MDGRWPIPKVQTSGKVVPDGYDISGDGIHQGFAGFGGQSIETHEIPSDEREEANHRKQVVNGRSRICVVQKPLR